MRWSVVVVAVWLGSVAVSRAQEPPPGDPFSYAVFAGSEARLGARVRVFGPVGANATVRVGRRNQIAGLVAAPTIELGRRTDTGDLFCILVVGSAGPCLPVNAPVVSPGSLGVGIIAPGTEDVVVPARAHRAPLEPGAYRRLRVGRGSAVVLVGGDYLFERVSLSRRATLQCLTSCRVAVRRALRLGAGASAESVAGATLRIDVMGERVRTGARLGRHATLAGLLWAPLTDVAVGHRARVGSAVGAALRVGARARIGTPPPG